jgi:hypothetical protein
MPKGLTICFAPGPAQTTTIGDALKIGAEQEFDAKSTGCRLDRARERAGIAPGVVRKQQTGADRRGDVGQMRLQRDAFGAVEPLHPNVEPFEKLRIGVTRLDAVLAAEEFENSSMAEAEIHRLLRQQTLGLF